MSLITARPASGVELGQRGAEERVAACGEDRRVEIGTVVVS